MLLKITTAEGYIIQSAKYKENDAIILLLTDKGKMSLKVRGGYKVVSKNHSATLIFNKVRLDIDSTDPEFLCVTAVQTLEDNTRLYEKLSFSLLLQFADELVIKEFQDKEDAIPYDFYTKTMALANQGFDVVTLAFVFACSCLKSLGYGPDIGECVNCGSKKSLIAFSFEEGGFLCARCAQEMYVHPDGLDYLKVIRYGFMVTPDKLGLAVLPKEAAKHALSEMMLYLEEQLGAKIKSLEMLLANA